MKLFIPIDRNPCALTGGIGEEFEVAAVTKKRRDGGLVQLAFWNGIGAAAAAYEFSETPEIIFTGKTPLDWNDRAPPVKCEAFAWNAASETYDGKPSYNTAQLTAKFVQADGVERELTTARNLSTGDASKLVAMENAAASTLTVPAALGAGSEVFFVLAAGLAGVTLAAGGGVTLNYTGGQTSAVATGDVVKITRTALNAFTVEPAPQIAEVVLMGEITWRIPSAPDDWTSTENFTVTIKNDVNQGGEGAPQNSQDPTNYYTKAAADALLALKADLAAVYTQAAADILLAAKANAADVYTKTAADALLAAKANAASVYTKTAADALLAAKQDSLADVVTAGTYRPRRVVYNAKGLATGLKAGVRDISLAPTNLGAVTTDLLFSDFTVTPADVVDGDILEMTASGYTNNGTTASTLTAGVTIAGVYDSDIASKAMGTTAASNVKWEIRLRLMRTGTLWKGSAVFVWKESAFANLVAIADPGSSPYTLGLTLKVSVGTGTARYVERQMIELR